jgi:transmembrane sensor
MDPFSADPTDPLKRAELRRALDAANRAVAMRETEEAYSAFLTRSRQSDSHQHVRAAMPRPSRLGLRTVFGGAALCGIAAFTGLNLWRSPSRSLASIHSYSTTAGQRAVVTLPTGSRIRMGPATTIRVAMRGTRANTTVDVNGEALFTVVPTDRSAFVVTTARAQLRVLGTTFSVRQYAAEPAARVLVVEGRVALQQRQIDDSDASRDRTETILNANTLAVVDSAGSIRTTAGLRAEDDTAWTSGRLVFRNTPARDVVAELGRAYDVEFRITDTTVAKYPLTWMVPTAQASLRDALSELADLLNASVKRTGRIITISPGRALVPAVPPSRHSLTSESQYGR